jgi:hypothetical protein
MERRKQIIFDIWLDCFFFTKLRICSRMVGLVSCRVFFFLGVLAVECLGGKKSIGLLNEDLVGV